MRTLAILYWLGFTLAGERASERDLYSNNGTSAFERILNKILMAVSYKMIYGDEPAPEQYIRELHKRPPNYKQYPSVHRGFGKGAAKDLTADYKEGDRFFFFPDANGRLQYVDSLKPVAEELIESYFDNEYVLYTRSNPNSPQFLVKGDVNSIRDSFFDPAKETVFFSHGWLGDAYVTACKTITKAFLQNNDVNVIIIDWSQLAKTWYPTSVAAVPKVGTKLGEFITWLTSLGLKYEKVHLVGFSLGGHVVGNAGRATQGKVKRITALDPAGPLWCFNSNRIVPTDGQYVEVIHTNVAFLGFKGRCGHADFYPNAGLLMPGCWTNTCSHYRSVEYMASTVKFNHLKANECKSILEVVLNRCSGSLYPMGNSDLRKFRSGVFRVNTKRDYPY